MIEQEQEAKKEATTPMIPEGSNENTGLSPPESERLLKNKTSGYLEKMSKAILSSKSMDTPMMSAMDTADTSSTIPVVMTVTTEHEFGGNEFRMQKLPRVFHPL